MSISSSTATDPHLLGSQYQLGDLKATYKPATAGPIIIACMFVVFGMILTIRSIAMSNPLGGIAFLDVFLVLVPLIYIGQTYPDRLLRVFVFEDGLVYVGPHSRQTIMRWQDVETIKHRVEIGSASRNNAVRSHTYTLTYKSGKTLTLDYTFSGIEELGKTIEVKTARTLFPKILDTYQTRQNVQFGALSLTSEGLYLYNGHSVLTWNELKSININETHGSISIFKLGEHRPWTITSLEEVSNVEVLRMLVQHITGDRPYVTWRKI